MNKSRTPRLKSPKFAVFTSNETEEKTQENENLLDLASQNAKTKDVKSNEHAILPEKQKKVNFKITSLQIDSDIEYKIDYICFIQKRKKYEVINELLSDAIDRMEIKFPNSL